MRILIITQDLRISGTSQGIIERSFLSKLRRAYPVSEIDVLYLCTHKNDDNLEILPVNSIEKKVINTKIPFSVKWINRFSRRFCNVLYAENFIHKQYASEILKVDFKKYDHIMVRSAGLDHETILAMHGLPILKQTIINFHDPYPYAWYNGNANSVNSNELIRLTKIIRIVNEAKGCCASAYYMAKDLQYLFASNKYFNVLSHQFDWAGFDLSSKDQVRRKNRKIQMSYHGALMFGRNMFIIIKAFIQLMKEYDWIKNDVELVLRVKGDGINKLKEMSKSYENIVILDTLDFSNSSNEQISQSDITIILENGPYYCNILGGKVPFLFSIGKKVFISSPERSELRRIAKDYPFLSDMNDFEDTKNKLYNSLIAESVDAEKIQNYFSDENFKKQLDSVLQA